MALYYHVSKCFHITRNNSVCIIVGAGVGKGSLREVCSEIGDALAADKTLTIVATPHQRSLWAAALLEQLVILD